MQRERPEFHIDHYTVPAVFVSHCHNRHRSRTDHCLTPKPQDKLAIGQDDVKQLVLLRTGTKTAGSQSRSS